MPTLIVLLKQEEQKLIAHAVKIWYLLRFACALTITPCDIHSYSNEQSQLTIIFFLSYEDFTPRGADTYKAKLLLFKLQFELNHTTRRRVESIVVRVAVLICTN